MVNEICIKMQRGRVGQKSKKMDSEICLYSKKCLILSRKKGNEKLISIGVQ